jgi:TonB family protein
MRRYGSIALFVALASGCACAQQVSPAPAPAKPDAPAERVKVYTVGPGFTAPEFNPLNIAPIYTDKCKKKLDGNVKLSMLVDTAGHPRNIVFLYPLGSDLDKFALKVAGADRFKPGTLDGKPVVVAVSLDINIQACIVASKDSAGVKTYSVQFRSNPVQKFVISPQPPVEAALAPDVESWKDPNGGAPHIYHIGSGVSAPIALNVVEAKFSNVAHQHKISGVCLVSLIVDAQGMPQDVQVIKKLEDGLDENALAAVNQYRFKPAMKDGEPVPAKITVEVNFKFF